MQHLFQEMSPWPLRPSSQIPAGNKLKSLVSFPEGKKKKKNADFGTIWCEVDQDGRARLTDPPLHLHQGPPHHDATDWNQSRPV